MTMTAEQFIRQHHDFIRRHNPGSNADAWYPAYIHDYVSTAASSTTTEGYLSAYDGYWKWIVGSCSIDPMSRVSVSFSEPEPCSLEELEEFLKGD